MKEKLVMLLLFAMFVGTGGMFYYQNVYLDQNEMEGKQFVVVAKENIAKGAKFVEGENYSYIALDKKFLFEDYIVVDSSGKYKEKLKEKVANSPILKNEIITVGRVDKEGDKEAEFKLFIKPDSKLEVEKGDKVNIYLKYKFNDPSDTKTVHYRTFLLMENRIVENIINKKDTKGTELPVLENIELHVEEKDAILYELATFMTEQKAEILVLEHNDLLVEYESQLPLFTEKTGLEDLLKIQLQKDLQNKISDEMKKELEKEMKKQMEEAVKKQNNE